VSGRQRENELIRVIDLQGRRFLSGVAGFALLVLAGARPAASPDSAARLGAGQAGRLLLDSAGTHIWFQGDATLGRFEGTATRTSGWAEVPDTLGFLGGRGHIEIEVASFRTGNGMRDGHLRGEMQAGRYPRITFEVRDVVAADLAVVDSLLAGVPQFSDDIPAARVFIEGDLTVRDQTRSVRLPARVRMAGDTMRVRGRLATRFTELGMKPPTRMLGTVKVKDDIVLLIDARFGRGGA
jgi:polyisoprenoid-binding protein YceI